jgi:hypothetical protein
MSKRSASLLLMRELTRRQALMNRAKMPELSRREALMKKVGVASRIPTPYYNKKGRQFFLTLKGVYVIRQNGKSLYGRRAASMTAPKAIRPKKVITKDTTAGTNRAPIYFRLS